MSSSRNDLPLTSGRKRKVQMNTTEPVPNQMNADLAFRFHAEGLRAYEPTKRYELGISTTRKEGLTEAGRQSEEVVRRP